MKNAALKSTSIILQKHQITNILTSRGYKSDLSAREKASQIVKQQHGKN
jgi:hypothetical protein